MKLSFQWNHIYTRKEIENDLTILPAYIKEFDGIFISDNNLSSFITKRTILSQPNHNINLYQLQPELGRQGY
jgi:hypothetical protein